MTGGPTRDPMRASCPETAEWQELVDGFAAFYNERSPISFALVAAAICEDQVLRTLQRSVPRIEKYGDIGHSLRVSLLEDMGIITTPVAKALRYFARIRNAFAHRPVTTTFETKQIVDLANQLQAQLEIESGTSGIAGYQDALRALERRFLDRGAQVPWSQPVARTLIMGFMALTYYLVWARHWARLPQKPKQIGEIGQHDCTKRHGSTVVP